MYVFTGYAIKTPDGEVQQQIFKTRAQAEEIKRQNQLKDDAVIQLFRFEKQPYVEPKEKNV